VNRLSRFGDRAERDLVLLGVFHVEHQPMLPNIARHGLGHTKCPRLFHVEQPERRSTTAGNATRGRYEQEPQAAHAERHTKSRRLVGPLTRASADVGRPRPRRRLPMEKVAGL
jgi:hypothetical protein